MSSSFLFVNCKYNLCPKFSLSHVCLSLAKMPSVVGILGESSAHGLPNAIKAKSWPLRVMWVVLFIGAVVGFSFHIKKLVDRYLEEPIDRTITSRGVQFEFPDMYICNPVPFSLSLLVVAGIKGDLNINTLGSEYRSRGALLQDGILKNSRILHNKNYYDVSYISTRALFSTMPYNSSFRKIINPTSQSIINASSTRYPLLLSDFQIVLNDRYLSCIKLLNTTALQTPDDKLTLYLFTDSYHKDKPVDLSSMYDLTFTGETVIDKPAGLILYFVERGSYPGTQAIEMLVSSGMSTEISLSMVRRQWRKTKKQTCYVGNSTIEVVDIINGPGKTLKFNNRYDICVADGWARWSFSACGCIPLHLPIPASLRNTSVRCLNTTHWSIQKAIDNLFCTDQLLNNATIKANIEKNCHDPCTQNVYSVRSSNALWPTSTLMRRAVQSLMLTNKDNRPNPALTVPGWIVLENYAANLNNNTQAVRESFMKVALSITEEKSTVITEGEAYPVFNFFSEFGGRMGLYLGVSLLTLCELIEVVRAIVLHIMVYLQRRNAVFEGDEMEKT